MCEQNEEKKANKCKSKSYTQNGMGDMVYCLGMIGAGIYFLSSVTGFWMGVLAILKAIVWPVFAVFGLLKFLAM